MKYLGNNFEELIENEAPESLIDLIKEMYISIDSDDEEDFEMDLGGGFYLIESLEDLSEIYTATLNEDTNEFYTINERADFFDICEYTSCKQFVQVLLCTNNAGGNTFLIPAAIAEQTPTVLESIERSLNKS
jgi:hypothetical protein